MMFQKQKLNAAILPVCVFSFFACASMANAADVYLKLQSPGKDLKVYPVILKGSELNKAAGNKKILRSSVRVFDASGKEIPSQIDSCNERGEYQSQAASSHISAYDELVFLADTMENGTFRINYNDSSEKQTEYPAQIKIVPTKDTFVDITLENADAVRVAVKASGAAKNEEKVVVSDGDTTKDMVTLDNLAKNRGFADASNPNALPLEALVDEKMKALPPKPVKVAKGDFAKGGMVLYYQGRNLLNVSSWESLATPIHPFGAVHGTSVPWTTPEIVIRGPVRNIVRIVQFDKQEKDQMTNGIYVRKGLSGAKTQIQHFFSIYGASGVVDFREIIDYDTVDIYVLLTYYFKFPGLHNDEDLVLHIPHDITAGKMREIALAEEQNKFPAKAPTYHLFRNPIQRKVLDGYFGWYDSKEKVGLALFYETPANGKDTFNLGIQVAIPFFQKKVIHGCENNILSRTFFNGTEKAGKRGMIRTDFRYMVYADTPADSIRQGYELWQNPGKYLHLSQKGK